MLKVWNRLPALTSAGALLGLLAFAPACGSDDEDPPAATGGTPTWQYIEFPDAFCRDGSQAGISISASTTGSKNLMIFLEGGGACFDALTCFGNPARVSQGSLQPKAGLFDRDNAENPVKDWNFVFVPYCTGDNHTGTKADGMIDGTPQKFVGYNNMTTFLKRMKTEFPAMDRVFLTGVSAGGFGAAGNVPQVTRTWPDAKGNLIDDSGPAMSSTYIPTCLQAKWNALWGLDNSIIAECGSTCKPDDFVLGYSLWLADKYNKQVSGMIETTEDLIIRGFYGVGTNNGKNDCGGSVVGTPVDPVVFKTGLLDFREQSKGFPNFGTYFPAGAQHTWLNTASLYTGEVSGVRMIDWVTDIVTDTKAAQVGP